MVHRDAKEVACLQHRALGYSNGDRKHAIRMLLDSALALIVSSDAAIRDWASGTLFNLACEASPDDCSKIADRAVH
jgi:hypothetical protein